MTAAETTPDDRLDALREPIDSPDYEEGEAWSAFDGLELAGLDTAAWAARKVSKLDARLGAIGRTYDDEVAILDAWRATEERRLQADREFFVSLLRGFHIRTLAEDPKAKTVNLPDGTTLTSQAGKVSVEVVDAAALIRFAEERELAEELLRWKDPEPDKAELAKRYGAKAAGETEPGEYPAIIAETGETVPGIKFRRGERTYNVKPPTPKD